MPDSIAARKPVEPDRVRLKILGIVFALLLIGVGALWTLQGAGRLITAPPSRSLATLGPIVAGFGVALGYVTLRGRR